MHVPARRLDIAQTYGGRKSDKGWLVIDVRGLELEGVTRMYVSLDEVAGLQTKRDQAKSRLAELFGEEEGDDFI